MLIRKSDHFMVSRNKWYCRPLTTDVPTEYEMECTITLYESADYFGTKNVINCLERREINSSATKIRGNKAVTTCHWLTGSFRENRELKKYLRGIFLKRTGSFWNGERWTVLQPIKNMHPTHSAQCYESSCPSI